MNFIWSGQFWLEALIVAVVSAVLTFIIGLLVSIPLGIIFDKMNITYKSNKWLIMGSALIITGFIVGLLCHIGFEGFGLNKKYCIYGYACN